MKTASLPLVLAAFALGACGAIIGIKDITLAEGDASIGGDADVGDGGGDGQGGDAADDGAPGDAGADGAGDAECGAVDDPLNCGVCGHDCLGGACDAGTCLPVTLASAQGDITAVTLDGTHVYFTSFANVVARVVKGGGAVDTLASAPNVELPKDVAVNNTHVYWANSDVGDGAIQRCLKAGCTGAPETLATPSEPVNLALTATHVYWADHNGGTIGRKSLVGGAEELVANAPDLPVAVDVGTVGTAPFFISDFSGQVFRALSDAGASYVTTNGVDGRDLLVDDTYVYFAAAGATGSGGRITRALRSSTGALEQIGTAGGDPRTIALDGNYIYWTAWATSADGGAGGGVYRCPRTGCGGPGPQKLADAQDQPRGIAVDNTSVYWGTRGSLMRVALPAMP